MKNIYSIFYLILILINSSLSTPSLFNLLYSSASLVREAIQYRNDEFPDATRVLHVYDYVVVGGGTAGCVIANRLTENPDVTVLLLEAGADESFFADIPLAVSYLQLLDINWKYRTQPQNSACLGLKNGRCNWPRGKVLGGSSVLNYMAFTRGNKKDFDRWRDLGNPGWGYEDILPYYLKLENVKISDYRYSGIRGQNGPMPVSFPNYITPLGHSFLEAGRQFGYDVIDYNGDSQTGFDYLQSTTFNGTRFSTNRAYLKTITHRKNLHVKKYATVTKILINPLNKQAYGVEFSTNGRRYKVKARHEVILSAGAIGTPQLLMLSGIGPAEHLHSLGIPVIQDLKVGYNLQDHIAFGGVVVTVAEGPGIVLGRLIDTLDKIVPAFTDYRQGPLTSAGTFEGIAFINTPINNETFDYPDIELMFFGASFTDDPTLPIDFGIDDDLYNTVYKSIDKKDSMLILPLLLRPESKGRILLKSRNPFRHPLIYPNYLTEGLDLERMLEGTKAAIALSELPAFKRFQPKLHDIPLPACRHHGFGTDDYWRCAIRQITLTIYHPCGTAKMGPPYDPDAVVDPELRVYGIKGLRVVDASIAPFVPTAHMNAVVLMIAERGADLIKYGWQDGK